jgi:tripartite-type tricarboxylate transporter receptor subunit TctC
MKKRLLDAGGDPLASTPDEYAQNIQREEGKWQAVIKKLGLVINN